MNRKGRLKMYRGAIIPISSVTLVKLVLILLSILIAANAVLTKNVVSRNGFNYVGSFKPRSSFQGRSTQSYDESNYYMSQNWGAWNSADKDCSEIIGDNATLVAIESLEEWNFLTKILQDYGFAHDYWTSGLWDASSSRWRWLASNIQVEEFAPWAAGHPSNPNSLLRVLVNYRNAFDASWRTVSYTQLHRYICEVKVPSPSTTTATTPTTTTSTTTPTTTSATTPTSTTTSTTTPTTTSTTTPTTTSTTTPTTTSTTTPTTTSTTTPTTTSTTTSTTTPTTTSTTTPTTTSTTTTTAMMHNQENSTSMAQPCYEVTDLAIVLDSSKSIGSDKFQTVLQFVERLASAFTVCSGSRLSFITFSRQVIIHFHLTNTLTAGEISSTILSTEWTGGSTNIGFAIQLGTLQFKTNLRGVPMNMLVLTDGDPESLALTIAAAQKAISAGIRTFAVGVDPDIEQHKLLEITENEQNGAHATSNFDELITLLEPLSKKLCPS